jgi:hypothetical protein
MDRHTSSHEYNAPVTFEVVQVKPEYELGWVVPSHLDLSRGGQLVRGVDREKVGDRRVRRGFELES